jgi:hypothetical protein
LLDFPFLFPEYGLDGTENSKPCFAPAILDGKY